jgi:ribosome-binding protein aMBF1 (putative translation factor)
VDLHNVFQQKLQKALRERGWSQTELARRMGWAQAVVNRYALGRVCPGLDTVEKFENALGCARGSLIDDQPLRLLEVVSS